VRWTPGVLCWPTGQAYKRLAEFTDTVGNRVSGSVNLRRAVDYMLNALQDDGLDNVHGEEASRWKLFARALNPARMLTLDVAVVPHWVRGKEHCMMLEPRHNYSINMLGLGSSVATGKDGLTAEVPGSASLELSSWMTQQLACR
jgi:carboxypeptidase Q